MPALYRRVRPRDGGTRMSAELVALVAVLALAGVGVALCAVMARALHALERAQERVDVWAGRAHRAAERLTPQPPAAAPVHFRETRGHRQGETTMSIPRIHDIP